MDDCGGVELKNCLVTHNTAAVKGGGMMTGVPFTQIRHSTFFENTAGEQGGGIWFSDLGNLIVTDSILWGDLPEEIYVFDWHPADSMPTVKYSDIQGGCPGEGNIDSDPLFVTGPDGSLYLSQINAGQAENSPCLDAAEPLSADVCFDMPFGRVCCDELTTRTDEATDIETLDMGYHFLPSSYVTPTPSITPTETCTLPPTPSPSPTVTPTPVCENLGTEIWMPGHYFTPGDICACSVLLCNPTAKTMVSIPVFVILDVYGTLFFAPGFSAFDSYTVDVPPGPSHVTVLPEFIWPEHAGTADGVLWYAAMTNPDMTALVGTFSTWSFSWND
jgi:hypothetical protein